MRNIELKARLRDWEAARRECRALDAHPQGDIHQLDTYFRAPEGRLKLREAQPGRTELVFYRRPNAPGPKACDYLLAPVEPSIKPLLTGALGVLATVDKTRTLYLWENVRIHLDRVTGLGEFIELEAVLSEEYDEEDGRRKLERLVESFGLRPDDLFDGSYLDMIRAAETARRTSDSR